MFRYVIFVALLSGGLGDGVNKDKDTKQPEGRIIGGRPALISEFPCLVSVQMNDIHRCGGALIIQDVVLTTAYCVRNIYARSLQVRAGSSYWNQLGVPMSIARIRIHERYNKNTNENNLALLRLTNPLRLSSNIQTIPLAAWNPPTGTAARIPGWGQTTSTQRPEHITVADVLTIDRRDCATGQYASLIKPDMICAGAPNVGPCNGDDGGPLIANGVLVGISSWGYGCALDLPGVYVSIAVQRNWIEYAVRSI